MSEETDKAEPDDGQAALDEAQGKGKPNATGERKSKTTNYVVLAAPIPGADDDRLPAYREIGRYQAHDGAGARRKAVEDRESGSYAQLRDWAAGPGVLIRSCPVASWGEPDADWIKDPKRQLRVEHEPRLVIP
jgi:hypothetical protein